MRLIDADYLKEIIEYQQTINPKLSVYDVIKLIDNAPILDLERTLRREYAEGYRDGKNECEAFYDTLWSSKQED